MSLRCFSFSTADGKQAQETGYLKDAYVNDAGETQVTQVQVITDFTLYFFGRCTLKYITRFQCKIILYI